MLFFDLINTCQQYSPSLWITSTFDSVNQLNDYKTTIKSGS